MLETARPLYLKLYGERNSGTRWVERLLQLNFCVRVLAGVHDALETTLGPMLRHVPPDRRVQMAADLYDRESAVFHDAEFGWKHARPPLDRIAAHGHADATLFVVVTRDPARWTRSLHRRPYDPINLAAVPYSDWLRRPWRTIGRDGLGGASYPGPVPMLMAKWAGYAALLEAMPRRALHVRYEDVLARPEGLVERLSTRLLRQGAKIRVTVQSTKPTGKTTEDYRAEQAAPLDTDPADLALIGEQTDAALAARFGHG